MTNPNKQTNKTYHKLLPLNGVNALLTLCFVKNLPQLCYLKHNFLGVHRMQFRVNQAKAFDYQTCLFWYN